MPPSTPLNGRAVAPTSHVLTATPSEYATMVAAIHAIQPGGLMAGDPSGRADGARPTRGAGGRGSGAPPSRRGHRRGAAAPSADRGRRRRSGSPLPVAAGSHTPAPL